jgi:hypothetical protein
VPRLRGPERGSAREQGSEETGRDGDADLDHLIGHLSGDLRLLTPALLLSWKPVKPLQHLHYQELLNKFVPVKTNLDWSTS